MQSPLPITNTCVNILETQFALHINLQYKLSRPWHLPREPGHISGSGYYIRGTVVAYTGFVGVFSLFENICGDCSFAYR